METVSVGEGIGCTQACAAIEHHVKESPMNSPSLKAVTEITCLAPQFLVDDLPEALAYYRDRLGFATDFVYQSFYASVSRDGFSIHLKCAPKTVADRAHRKQNEHLDVYVGVHGIDALYDELKTKEANIIRALEDRPWGYKDFYVEDLDGYILCFSEENESQQ
jgi:uncharacterized glyoxalase superfamily protein PhnB